MAMPRDSCHGRSLAQKKPFSSQEKKSMVKILCLGDSMGNLLSGQISELGKHDVRIF